MEGALYAVDLGRREPGAAADGSAILSGQMTSAIRVFFNPGCSKCRGVQELLEARGEVATYVRYLEDRPTRAHLEAIVRMLGLASPRGMIRTGEAVYGELGLASAGDDRLLDAMVEHPILIERPIVIRGERAIIARPPEKLLELLRDDVTDDVVLLPTNTETTYEGGCHCGRVRFRVQCDLSRVTECNCSMCTKKGYLHVIVPRDAFELIEGESELATYRFNTAVAAHHFCRHCGIHSFYVPRSDPDKIDVNARCLDGVDLPSLAIARFDGRHWEESMKGRVPWRE